MGSESVPMRILASTRSPKSMSLVGPKGGVVRRPNCANAASTPSINFAVDVSSIGSVADRSEMPSDCRSERSAK